MVRALLVDDEQPARERLRRLLAAFDEVEVVGEAEDGEHAFEQILALTPDVVFLDIQMPGCSGLDVAASLPALRPKLVFCTAFDQHAVDAFELQAVDYLLKPVTRARLAEAIRRLPVHGRRRDAVSSEASGRTRSEYPARFLAKHGARYQVVPARAVLLFASEGGLTQLRTAERRSWIQPRLSELEARLDPARFFRISRAAIVNLDAVREVAPLSNGDRIAVSRRRFKALVDRLGVS
jgi:two-component system LytT family response regulator